MARKKRAPKRVQNVVVLSDLHIGCRLALAGVEPFRLDDGGWYEPSEFQRGLWAWWLEFWSWALERMHGEAFDLVINGDLLEGVHHRAISQISQNHMDQHRLAAGLLPEFTSLARKLYVIRGTEAHGGASEQHTEMLAREAGDGEWYARTWVRSPERVEPEE